MSKPDITVKRAYFNDCTLSRLYAGMFRCFSLELPWLGNEVNISCIPEGVYDYKVAPSPRLNGKDVIWIGGVEDRSSIQIHPGNYTRDILGCVAVGDRIMYIDGDDIPDVGNSVNTFDKILDSIPDKGKIRITNSEQPGSMVYM